MKKTLIIWCGDSWPYGSELLDRKKDCFPKVCGNLLGVDIINLSIPGSSIQHLNFKLKQILRIKNKFINHNIIVLFGLTVPSRLCIEPDIGKKITVSPNLFDLCAYKIWAKDVFSNRHIQTQTIISLIFLADQCKKNNISFKFFNILCNFRDFDNSWFFQFLNTSDWLISPEWSAYSELFDINNFDFTKMGMLEKTSRGKLVVETYIKPSITHPNIAGHQKIAQKMIPYITQLLGEYSQ